MKIVSLVIILIFLSACSDKAITNVYSKELLKEGIPCMRLVVFPPDKKIESYFRKLHKFDTECKFKMQVEKKGGITCNSKHNTQSKAMGSFPSSFLNINISKENSKIYGYYIDLIEDVKEDDVEDALKRIKRDLSL